MSPVTLATGWFTCAVFSPSLAFRHSLAAGFDQVHEREQEFWPEDLGASPWIFRKFLLFSSTEYSWVSLLLMLLKPAFQRLCRASRLLTVQKWTARLFPLASPLKQWLTYMTNLMLKMFLGSIKHILPLALWKMSWIPAEPWSGCTCDIAVLYAIPHFW